MSQRAVFPVVATLIGAAGVSAQAPVITPAGDPSVDADTIYALAAHTAANDGPVVFLLDDAVIRLDAAGRGTRTYRQIVHVREQRAVAGFAERRLRYSPGREQFTLNWARVPLPDGGVISGGPAQMQGVGCSRSDLQPGVRPPEGSPPLARRRRTEHDHRH